MSVTRHAVIRRGSKPWSDGYDSSNYAAAYLMCGDSGADGTQVAHRITPTEDVWLDSFSFYVSRYGVVSGNIESFVYADDGGVGSASGPTGSPLAVGSTVNISSIAVWMSLGLEEFRIPPLLLRANVHYWICVQFTGGASAQGVMVGTDISSPTHEGHDARFKSGSWIITSNDAIFEASGTIKRPLLTYSYKEPERRDALVPIHTRQTSPISTPLFSPITSDMHFRTAGPVYQPSGTTHFPLTMAAWIRFTSAGGYYEGVCGQATTGAGNGSSPNLSKNSSGVMGWMPDYDGTSAATCLMTPNASLNTWYHVVGTSGSNSDHELFVDGVSDTTSTTTCNNADPNTGRFIIGNGDVGGVLQNTMGGYVCHVAIYDYRFTESQAMDLYMGRDPRDFAPIAYWPLVNGDMRDWSGNRHMLEAVEDTGASGFPVYRAEAPPKTRPKSTITVPVSYEKPIDAALVVTKRKSSTGAVRSNPYTAASVINGLWSEPGLVGSTFSIMAWIWTPGALTSGYPNVFSVRSGNDSGTFTLNIELSQTRAQAFVYPGSFTTSSTGSYDYGQWNAVGMSWDATNYDSQAYCNQTQGTNTLTDRSDPDASSIAVWLGNPSGGGGINGYGKRMAIWNSDLELTHFNRFANGESPLDIDSANLVSYIPADRGLGDAILGPSYWSAGHRGIATSSSGARFEPVGVGVTFPYGPDMRAWNLADNQRVSVHIPAWLDERPVTYSERKPNLVVYSKTEIFKQSAYFDDDGTTDPRLSCPVDGRDIWPETELGSPRVFLPATFSCWFYPTATANWQTLMGVSYGSNDYAFLYSVMSDSEPTLGLHTGDKLWLADYTNHLPGINQWYHVTGSIYNLVTNAYEGLVNGVHVREMFGYYGQGVQDFADRNTYWDLNIGCNAVWPEEGFSGYICNAAFWATRLSEREMLELYRGVSPLEMRPERLVAYLPDGKHDVLNGEWTINSYGGSGDFYMTGFRPPKWIGTRSRIVVPMSYDTEGRMEGPVGRRKVSF